MTGAATRLAAARLAGVNQRRVADSDPDQKSVAVLGGQRRVLFSGLLCRVHPQVENAGGDRRCGSCAEKVAHCAEDVATDIGDPQCAIAE